ncbi:MAG: hypothetical protein IPJ80_14275 [Saprospiraceae bacterium]|nr:hypothetical protein [Saprospiraceae bacterium]
MKENILLRLKTTWILKGIGFLDIQENDCIFDYGPGMMCLALFYAASTIVSLFIKLCQAVTLVMFIMIILFLILIALKMVHKI